MKGIDLIRAERQRQIIGEGYLPQHDDGHAAAELAQAALCYRNVAHMVAIVGEHDDAPNIYAPPSVWPWELRWWKPSWNPIRNLAKAGGLYLAESDRCDRADQPSAAMQHRVYAEACGLEIDELIAREKPTFKSHMKKHLKYLRYVVRHKWFVLLACIEHGILWRGLVHDWSKFLPSEWFAYAEFFYGRGAHLNHKKRRTQYLTPDELLELEKIQRAFDHAWLKHQHRSPHHWQHHILREDSGNVKLLEMSLDEATEMVCDWIGAGRAITGKEGTTVDWYLRNRAHMALGYRTRVLVEDLLGVPDDEKFKNARINNGCSIQ